MSELLEKEGCTDYRRVLRTKQNIYECRPCPPPAVVRCSVCHTVERANCNIWNRVPFVSYSTFFGPNLADVIIHILNLMPLSVVSWLGIGHQQSCTAKPPVVNYDPINKTTKKTAPTMCEPSGRVDGGEHSSSGDNLSTWMREEYINLAKELANLKWQTSEENDSSESHDLLQARNYVLDRLAEMLAKREQIEKKIKKKKQKGLH